MQGATEENSARSEAGGGFWSPAVIAAVVAFEGLLTWAILFIASLDSVNRERSEWWRVAKLLLRNMMWPQWMSGVELGAVTGLMFAVGVGRRRLSVSLLVASLAVGALVPIGFLLLTGALGRIWPNTNSPLDKPALAMILAVYAIGVPFGIGRLTRRCDERGVTDL